MDPFSPLSDVLHSVGMIVAAGAQQEAVAGHFRLVALQEPLGLLAELEEED